MKIRSLLAKPLYQASLKRCDHQAALRYIGMGAAFSEQDLRVLDLLRNDSSNLSRLQVPVQSSSKIVNWTLLHCAAYFGHAEAAESLLLRLADLEAKTSFGLTPLHQASRNGQVDVIEILLQRQANIEANANMSRTALNYASHQGHLQVVELLLHRGAKVDCRNCKGETPLHSAAMSGHDDVVQVLLEYSADSSALSSEGMTPLHCAAQFGNAQAAESLVGSPGGKKLSRMITKRGSALDLAERGGHDEVAEILRMASNGIDEDASA
ncbi:unnamed protein product [Polarella glacialis]|uniref:Ankyrin repeat protein n=1 Tax=Polarella glacialis TaxID=89957 RepID=A0A813IA09_POLGL|nr:unnamed protein product [Polarella glacialis]CAE8647195.1 unnamed protein product [Polarella glacialis]